MNPATHAALRERMGGAARSAERHRAEARYLREQLAREEKAAEALEAEVAEIEADLREAHGCKRCSTPQQSCKSIGVEEFLRG